MGTGDYSKEFKRDARRCAPCPRIGLATLQEFISQGATVGFTARRPDGVNAVAAKAGNRCAG